MMLLISPNMMTYDDVAEIMAVFVERDCDGSARNVVSVRRWGKVAVCNESVQSFTFVPAIGLSILESVRHFGNTGSCKVDA